MDLKMRDQFLSSWQRYFGGAEFPSPSITPTGKIAQNRRRLPRSTSVSSVPWPRCERGSLSSLTCKPSDVLVPVGISVLARSSDRTSSIFCHADSPVFSKASDTSSPRSWSGNSFFGGRDSAPGRFIVFKRWDALEETDTPEVVIFFASPDVLSGLFTLANFDEAEPNGASPAPSGPGAARSCVSLSRTAGRTPPCRPGDVRRFGASVRAP